MHSGKKDSDIKETITSTAKKEINFAGVNNAVSDGVVALNGHCTSDKGRSQVEQIVSCTPGVEKVVNNIVVAPVVLDDDYPLKQSVDSVLMNAATIQPSVEDSTVLLQGQSNTKQIGELVQKLNQLKPKAIKNEVTIR